MTPQDPASDSERNRLVRLANLDHVAAGESRSAESAQPPSGFSGRWTRRQWAQASLLATGAALVFALVPGFSSAMQPRSGDAHVATMALPLPPAPATAQDEEPAVEGETGFYVVWALNEALHNIGHAATCAAAQYVGIDGNGTPAENG